MALPRDPIVGMNRKEVMELVFIIGETTDLRLLDIFRRHINYNLRAAVGGNRAAWPAMLLELAVDQHVEVRIAVAANPSLPQEAVDLVLADPVLAVQRGLAGNPMTPTEKLREWVGYWNKTDIAIASNPSCPADVMDRIIEIGHTDACVRLVCNPSTPIHLLDRMGSLGDIQLRTTIAENERTPLPTILRLLRDEASEVRHAALGHWLCPVQFLVEAAETKDFYIWDAVARNPRTPASVLNRLSRYVPEEYEYDSSEADWEMTFTDVLRSLAENPMLPEAVYDKLVNHEDVSVATLAGKLPILAKSLFNEEEPDIYRVPQYDEMTGNARYKADHAGS